MPTKIEANLESAPQINVTSTPKSYDTSLARDFAIKGVGVASEAVADHFNRVNLHNAQEDIDAATTGAIEAQAAEGQQREALLQQMMSADDNVQAKAAKELDELRLARDQGVMSSQEREIRVNQLVKWYANQYPHLASQFRAMGSQANENIAGALRASAGQDPIEKGRADTIAEAYSLGVTPYELIQSKNAAAIYDLQKKRGDALAFSRDAKKEDIFISLQDQQSAWLTNRAVGVMKELSLTIKNGGPIHSEQVMALLEQARTQDKQFFARQLAEYQSSSGVSLTVDQKGTLESDIDDLYNSLKVQIGALRTSDQLEKWATSNANLLLAQGRERFTIAAMGNFSAQLAASSPEAFQAWINSGNQAQIAIKRLTTGAGGDRSLAEQQFFDIYKNDPKAMFMFQQAQKGNLDNLMAAAVGDSWTTGAPIDTGVPVLDHQAKGITLDMYDRETFQNRSKVTANLVNSLDYTDITQSPTLMGDIRNSQEATNGFIEKATLQAMDWLGTPGTRTEMQIDYSSYNSPISYKHYSALGHKNAQKANVMYRQIRDTVGFKAAQAWLDELTNLGVTTLGTDVPLGERAQDQQPGSTSGGPQSRGGPASLREAVGQRATKESPDAASLVQYTLSLAPQFGVPVPLAKAFLQVESSMGKNLVGPVTSSGDRAGGPLMIMPQTFQGINEQKFGGRLAIASNNDKALASMALLGDLIAKHGVDNVTAIAGEYHGGPQWKMDNSDGNMTTREYIAEISRLLESFTAMEKETQSSKGPK